MLDNFNVWTDSFGEKYLECRRCTDAGRDVGQLEVDNLADIVEAAEQHWEQHVIEDAEADVKAKAPLDDPAEQLLTDLKAVASDIVDTYRPVVTKVLTDFGLKHFLK